MMRGANKLVVGAANKPASVYTHTHTIYTWVVITNLYYINKQHNRKLRSKVTLSKYILQIHLHNTADELRN